MRLVVLDRLPRACTNPNSISPSGAVNNGFRLNTAFRLRRSECGCPSEASSAKGVPIGFIRCRRYDVPDYRGRAGHAPQPAVRRGRNRWRNHFSYGLSKTRDPNRLLRPSDVLKNRKTGRLEPGNGHLFHGYTTVSSTQPGRVAGLFFRKITRRVFGKGRPDLIARS